MKKELLKDLADFLAKGKFPKGGTFHMGDWGVMEIPDDAQPEAHDGHICYPCKTTACALGWAPAVPSIAKAGLDRKLTELPRGPGDMEHSSFTIKGKVVDDEIKVAMQIFGVNSAQAVWLFLPRDMDITAKQQAARMRKFLKVNGNLEKLDG